MDQNRASMCYTGVVTSNETPDVKARGAEVRLPPPLIFLGAVLLGVGLQQWISPMPVPVDTPLRWVAGGVVIGLGVVLMFAANRPFSRTGQDPKPWKPSPEFFRDGIYRFSRNPMYVSMTIIQLGLGVALDNQWIVVLLPVSVVMVQQFAVVHEETYLETRFGDAYRTYKREVRRWL